MADTEIVPVESNAHMKTFIELPWKLYSPADNWVPPLKAEVRRLLDPRKHPFWEFAERGLFLALRHGEAVGRIAGIIDRNYNDFHNERVGIWGFFECENRIETASALFAAAEQWVADRGMSFIRGPMNPSTNYEIGMLIEGFEHAPALMMPFNPPYYNDLVEACGYDKEKDLFAYLIEESYKPSDKFEKLADRITERHGVTLRTVNMQDLESDVRLIRDIYHECWSENWGFVPMTDGEVGETVKALKRIGDPDLVVIVSSHGEAAGVCMVLPDINPILKQLNGKVGILGSITFLLKRRKLPGMRLILFGFRKRFQKLGLPLVPFRYMDRVGRAKNYKYLEMGWTLEDHDGINRLAVELGGVVYKRYRIYCKQLS